MASQNPNPGAHLRSQRTLGMRVPPDAVLAAWRQQAVRAEVLAFLAGAAPSSSPRRAGPRPRTWTWHEEAVAGGDRVRLVSDDLAAPVRAAELRVLPAAAEYGAEATLVIDHTTAEAPDERQEGLADRMLRRFKALLETGEIATPSGSRWERRRTVAANDPAAASGPMHHSAVAGT